MIRVTLRHVGTGAFLAAIGLAACAGGGAVQPSATPTPSPTATARPTTNPTGPTPTPTPTATVQPTPSPTVSGAEAIISFTGSYTFGPFTILMYSNGVATVIQASGQSNQFVPGPLTHQFYHELALNLPVNDIQVAICPKPTTAPLDTTTITYQSETSGDISCFGPYLKTKALYESVVAIEQALDLRTMLRSRRQQQ